ncbi:uncharacterized protein PV07_01611 [Cladophialophora immunda]|uniref:Secreted protein n=1 Tax=Cladophialophora immunda TaxID=569365 RepID=A0A0D2DGH7_9EURO|nr:uncharacterized protein PV07_01611 [Cladophialophora immunda]KIW34864.1 hypothetical protein PV07_01611 [Cladophialophora immunda]
MGDSDSTKIWVPITVVGCILLFLLVICCPPCSGDDYIERQPRGRVPSRHLPTGLPWEEITTFSDQRDGGWEKPARKGRSVMPDILSGVDKDVITEVKVGVRVAARGRGYGVLGSGNDGVVPAWWQWAKVRGLWKCLVSHGTYQKTVITNPVRTSRQ